MRAIVVERAARLEPLGQTLREQGRSWYWLSKQIGVARQRLQAYKDGAYQPPADFFVRAAAALGVSVEQVDGRLSMAATIPRLRQQIATIEENIDSMVGPLRDAAAARGWDSPVVAKGQDVIATLERERDALRAQLRRIEKVSA